MNVNNIYELQGNPCYKLVRARADGRTNKSHKYFELLESVKNEKR